MSEENLNIKVQSTQKETLLNIFSELKGLIYTKLNNREKETLNNLFEKLKHNVVSFVVIGQFKRGKSTFINALLGEKILPTGVIPLTSIITIIKYSEKLSATVYFNNNLSKEINLLELSSYIAEKENPSNIKNVNYILIGHPAEILKKGMVFVDTPGVGSLHLDNTRLTNQYISKIDAAIFVTSTDPALSESEIKFLEKVLNITDKIFIVINKIDYLNKNELEEFYHYTNLQLNKRFENKPVKVYYVSAKEALNSKLNGDYITFSKSSFANLENSIINYFEQEKENILLESVQRQLLELINEIEISLDLEIKTLSLPIEQLREKIRILNNNLSTIQANEKEYIKKLKLENKLLLDNYRERIYQIKLKLVDEIKEELLRFTKENAQIKYREFKIELDKLFRELIKDKLETSRITIEKEIKEKSKHLYKEILDNFNKKINEIYKITSEIFNLELSMIHLEVDYDFPEEFQYITYDFKLMFNLDKSMFAFLLPKEKRKKIIIDKYSNRIEFTVNYNLGYITDSIERRLEKNLMEYNINLRNKINETIERIREILSKVTKIKEREKLKYDSIIQNLKFKKEKLELLKNNLK
ncbi:MAG: dynamin family protein [Ignavibacteria bacterium]|nr:dynamin family protein [Ignavibacteria bacterium]